MTSRDLTATLPLLRAQLMENGSDASLSSVLSAMGLTVPPVLEEEPSSLSNIPSARLEELPQPGPTRPYPAPRTPDTAAPAGPRVTMPSRLGRLEAGAELGRGGMGVVLEPRDPELRRVVAVKLVGNPRSISDAHLGRFVAEAQITSQLQHPNIIPVHDIGYTDDGEIYFVMKKVQGRSLREILRGLRKDALPDAAEWTLRRLLVVFVQICNAVAYAHDRGVLHRDLKPENVMLGPFGETLVMDWGVARVLRDDSEELVGDVIERITLQPTLAGVAVGTPGYMSPEQANGDLPAQDARSDVWSLGAILYEILTWNRAYTGTSLYQLLWAASEGPPIDPRLRAPERGIPDAIARICTRALQPAPADRFQSAGALADAVEAFMEGSRRRQAASGYVRQARAAWSVHEALTHQLAALTIEEAALSVTVPPWGTLDEKADLLRARRRLAELAPERAEALGNVLAMCEYALGHDPQNPPARRFLADVFHSYFVESEETDSIWSGHYAERVRLYDGEGRYATSLAGRGTLRVACDRPAHVYARRVLQVGLIWELAEVIDLGPTPLLDLPVDHGSWLLTLRAAGVQDTVYPVWLPRLGRWDGDEVPLFTAEQIGDGFVYVPPGAARMGGDARCPEGWPAAQESVDGFFAAERHVTLGDYVQFLNTLSPDEARSRAPRREDGVKRGVTYLDVPAPGEPWAVLEVDEDGDPWSPDWPVFGISWHDALAYCRSRGLDEGRGAECYRLPTEREWEKLARGVDGRFHPWGDGFDPALCKMRLSRSGTTQPEAGGAFPHDVSVYGARDLAGTMREWCMDPDYNGDPSHRPVRGGSWRSSPMPCRGAYRFGFVSDRVYSTIGFRLVRSAPL